MITISTHRCVESCFYVCVCVFIYVAVVVFKDGRPLRKTNNPVLDVPSVEPVTLHCSDSSV